MIMIFYHLRNGNIININNNKIMKIYMNFNKIIKIKTIKLILYIKFQKNIINKTLLYKQMI